MNLCAPGSAGSSRTVSPELSRTTDPGFALRLVGFLHSSKGTPTKPGWDRQTALSASSEHTAFFPHGKGVQGLPPSEKVKVNEVTNSRNLFIV